MYVRKPCLPTLNSHADDNLQEAWNADVCRYNLILQSSKSDMYVRRPCLQRQILMQMTTCRKHGMQMYIQIAGKILYFGIARETKTYLSICTVFSPKSITTFCTQIPFNQGPVSTILHKHNPLTLPFRRLQVAKR
jgi:hypothetical protein